MLRERGLQTPLGFDRHSQRSVDELETKFVLLRENELYDHKNCTSVFKVLLCHFWLSLYLSLSLHFITGGCRVLNRIPKRLRAPPPRTDRAENELGVMSGQLQ